MLEGTVRRLIPDANPNPRTSRITAVQTTTLLNNRSNGKNTNSNKKNNKSTHNSSNSTKKSSKNTRNNISHTNGNRQNSKVEGPPPESHSQSSKPDLKWLADG